MEVAFHESGLQYGNLAETTDRVLKKMLRTLLILRAFRPRETQLQIYFLSPNVNPSVQQSLEEIFAALSVEYPDVEWRFFANDDFVEAVVGPTLEKASGVADSSELFLRSVKLLELAGYRANLNPSVRRAERGAEEDSADATQIQPLVKELMHTLLVEAPLLLSDVDRRNLQDNEHCKRTLGLRIGNFALLRRTRSDTDGKGRNRYWADPYDGFYVCSQWGKPHHRSNARCLLAFVKDIVARNAGPKGDVLRRHEQAFREYLGVPT